MTAEILGMIIGVYALLMVISSIDLILRLCGFEA
jgi:hypothetical protein